MVDRRRECTRTGRLAAGLLMAAFCAAPAAGQPAQEVAVPSFWDTAHRLEKPNLDDVRAIRFLVEAEDPPFAFIGADGHPTGFSVELARAICIELAVPCTVQPLRWDILADAIAGDIGDAVVGSFSIDGESRARFDFSTRFLTRPARFAVARNSPITDTIPETLGGRRIAVAEGTAHEAFLRAFFPGSAIATYRTESEARQALKSGTVELLFADGLNTSLWLNGTASQSCCRFAGGPFTESRYFGEGLAIAVKPGNDRLIAAFDFALARIQGNGTYREIYLRYFPVSFY
jgi:polar amino acid transport system substrate-binding protein